MADTTSSFVIGRSLAGPDEYSDGQIDDYKIYRRKLSGQEIQQAFVLGRSKFTVENKISLYPNPANDVISIQSSLNLNNAYYSITDVAGKIELSGKLN